MFTARYGLGLSIRYSFALKGLMRCFDISTLLLQGPGNTGSVGGGGTVHEFWDSGVKESETATALHNVVSDEKFSLGCFEPQKQK